MVSTLKMALLRYKIYGVFFTADYTMACLFAHSVKWYLLRHTHLGLVFLWDAGGGAGWAAFLCVADPVFPESFSEPAEYQVPASAFLAKVEDSQEQGMIDGNGAYG